MVCCNGLSGYNHGGITRDMVGATSSAAYSSSLATTTLFHIPHVRHEQRSARKSGALQGEGVTVTRLNKS